MNSFNVFLQEWKPSGDTVNYWLDDNVVYDVIKEPGLPEDPGEFELVVDPEEVEMYHYFRVERLSWTLALKPLFAKVKVTPKGPKFCDENPLILEDHDKTLLLRDGDRIDVFVRKFIQHPDSHFIVRVVEDDNLNVSSGGSKDKSDAGARWRYPISKLEDSEEAEVQVGSSDPTTPTINPSKLPSRPADDSRSRGNSEVLIKQSFTEQTSLESDLTPRLSVSRSEKVEDTPAAHRFLDEHEFNPLATVNTSSVAPNSEVEVAESPTEISIAKMVDVFHRSETPPPSKTSPSKTEYFSSRSKSSFRSVFGDGQKRPEDREVGSDASQQETEPSPVRHIPNMKKADSNGLESLVHDHDASEKVEQDSKEGGESVNGTVREGRVLKEVNIGTPKMRKPKRPERPLSSVTASKRRKGTSETSETTSVMSEIEVNSPRRSRSAPVEYRVVFSNSAVTRSKDTSRFLEDQKLVSVETVTEADILCIRNGELRKTAKLLLAITLGKRLVSDDWISKSQKAGRLLPPGDFLPHDPVREKEWKFSIQAASGKPRKELLSSKTVIITPSLRKDFGKGIAEIEEIARSAGAHQVLHPTSKKLVETSKEKDADSIILLAKDNEDVDFIAAADHGLKGWHKDLLLTSILRGELDLESDEFRLHSPDSVSTEKGRKTPNSRRK